MENNKEEIVFEMIPIEMLLEVLTRLYDDGANYVDIIGIVGQEGKIAIAVKDDYYEDDGADDSLSDKDLDELI